GAAADEPLDLRSARRPVPERPVQAAKQLAPLGVAIDDLAERVQHVAALVVHVARPLIVHVGLTDDGVIISNSLSIPDDVARAGLLTLLALRVEALGVVRETLVHPHVRMVL